MIVVGFWTLGGFLAVAGIYILVMNLLIMASNLAGGKWRSPGPVLGGLALSLGILIMPWQVALLWSWMPLAIDLLVFILYVLIGHLLGNSRQHRG